MPGVTKGPVLTFFWRVHRFLLRLTKGRFFTRLGPGRQLLLITKGRKSGEPRSVGLTYIKDGDRFVVIASNAGDDRHPAWWLNLQSDQLRSSWSMAKTFQSSPVKCKNPNGDSSSLASSPRSIRATSSTSNAQCAASLSSL